MRATGDSVGDRRRRPREVTGRTVLFCIVAFFGVVALVNAIMIRAAVSTFGGLETESSYKAGLAFAREIAASEAQNQRGWKITARLSGIAEGRMQFDLTALDAGGLPLVGYEARARLSHPTDRRHDREIDLVPSGAGRFKGQTATASGQWDVIVDLMRGEQRMFRSRERIVLDEGTSR